MRFEATRDILLSDSLIPDIFLSDVMPNLPSDAVKVYLYCLFLSKYGKEAKTEDLAAKLGMTPDSVNASFLFLEREELILRTPQTLSLIDLKEREIMRLYRRKATSEASAAVARTALNVRRNQCLDSINKMFFQGLMSPSWYTAIDNWFEQFRFDEDVMVSLFKYCYDRNALNVNYIGKVAATWSSRGITSHWELEKYMELQEKVNDIGRHIVNALRLGKPLSIYDEPHLERWINDFGYDREVIELAMEKTAGGITKPIPYMNKILSEWHAAGLKNKDQVQAFLQTAAASKKGKKKDPEKVSRRDNFMQRAYDDAFFDMLNNSFEKGKGKGDG